MNINNKARAFQTVSFVYIRISCFLCLQFHALKLELTVVDPIVITLDDPIESSVRCTQGFIAICSTRDPSCIQFLLYTFYTIE